MVQRPSLHLESFPVITIEGDDLVITCKDQKLTTALTGVQDYHFIEKTVTTSISSVPSNDPKGETATPSFSFSNAEVSGLKQVQKWLFTILMVHKSAQ